MPAIITGWGRCVPPAVLTNDDLQQVMATVDERLASAGNWPTCYEMSFWPSMQMASLIEILVPAVV